MRSIRAKDWRSSKPGLRFWLGLSAGMALGLTVSSCGGGYGIDYYDPYAYYTPGYGDWTYWYDDGDCGWWDSSYDCGWWYPASRSGVGNPRSAQSVQSVQPTPGSDERKDLKAQIAAYNQSVVNVMGPLSELAKQTPSSPHSGVQAYGPQDLPTQKPTATFRLTIKKIRAQKYGWQLGAKPIGADDSMYKDVLVGSLENAVSAHRGAGVAGFYLDNLHATNPVAYPATGQLIVTTGAGPQRQNSLVTRLVGFSPDGKAPPISAVYAGDRTADGAHHIRWQMNSERIAGMPDSGPEQVVDYVTWRPDKGSRIYTVVSSRQAAPGMSSGDLPANTYLIGQSCYAKDGALLYKAWNRCEAMPPSRCLGTPPILVETSGKTAADCTVDAPSPPVPTLMLLSGPTDTAPTTPPLLPERIPASTP